MELDRGVHRTRRSLLVAAAFVPFLAVRASAAGGLVELSIASDGDEMAFNPTRLSCPTGVRVRLRFSHRGKILDDPHDWVLLEPGMMPAFLADADRQPDESHVVPPGDDHMVIAHTPMCAKGHSVVVEFMAPPIGSYPFVCSVPGHGATMNGILTVS